MAPSYDLPAPYTDMFGHYDLVSRIYSLTGFIAETGGLRHTQAAARPRVDRRLARRRRRPLTPRGGRTEAAPCTASRRLSRALLGGARRRALAPLAAQPAARAGATCSTRRRATSALAARGAAQRARARRRAHRRGRPARPRAVLRRRRRAPGSRPRCRSARTSSRCPSRRRRTAGRSATTASCCTAPTPARTWTRQLDGRSVGEAMVEYYGASSRTAADPKRAAALLDEAKRFAAQGAENPFLDVWFEDERERLRRRRLRPDPAHRDGGATWEPLAARGRQPEGACTCTRCAASAATSTSPASRACALKLDARRRPLPRARAAVPGHAVRRHRQRARDRRASACAAPCCAAPTAARSWQHGPDRPAGRADRPARSMRAAASCSSARPATCSSARDDGASFAPRQARAAVPAAAVVGAGDRARRGRRPAWRPALSRCPEARRRSPCMHPDRWTRRRPPGDARDVRPAVRLAPRAAGLQQPARGGRRLRAAHRWLLGVARRARS